MGQRIWGMVCSKRGIDQMKFEKKDNIWLTLTFLYGNIKFFDRDSKRQNFKNLHLPVWNQKAQVFDFLVLYCAPLPRMFKL